MILAVGLCWNMAGMVWSVCARVLQISVPRRRAAQARFNKYKNFIKFLRPLHENCVKYTFFVTWTLVHVPSCLPTFNTITASVFYYKYLFSRVSLRARFWDIFPPNFWNVSLKSCNWDILSHWNIKVFNAFYLMSHDLLVMSHVFQLSETFCLIDIALEDKPWFSQDYRPCRHNLSAPCSAFITCTVLVYFSDCSGFEWTGDHTSLIKIFSFSNCAGLKWPGHNTSTWLIEIFSVSAPAKKSI